MTERSFPFNGQASGADDWASMASLWLPDGVVAPYLNQLRVYADSSGMQVKRQTGAAWVAGAYYTDNAELVIPIAAADPTSARIDRIVARKDMNNSQVTTQVIQGTPGSTPAVPPLAQNMSPAPAGLWDLPLAQVWVSGGGVTIPAGAVTAPSKVLVAPMSGYGIRRYNPSIIPVNPGPIGAPYGLVSGGIALSGAGSSMYGVGRPFGPGNPFTLQVDGAYMMYNQGGTRYELTVQYFQVGIGFTSGPTFGATPPDNANTTVLITDTADFDGTRDVGVALTLSNGRIIRAYGAPMKITALPLPIPVIN